MTHQNLYISSPDLGVHITLSDTIVESISFEGAQAQDPILEKYIPYCVGYSLRECAEHSAQYVVHDMCRGQKRQPQQGIDSIHMLSPNLERAQSLLRQALHQQSTQLKDWNFEDRGLSTQWQQKSTAQQKLILDPITQQYLNTRGYPAETLTLVQIDQYGRLFYEFSADTPVGVKPSLLLGLEHEFQQVLHERLEVFLTEMKDQHKLRRL